jgi:hypothetical protein
VAVASLAVASEEDQTVYPFADGQVDRASGAGGRGIVTTLPPLNTVIVRWPRSRPSASMSAPSASETRRPLIASSDTRAGRSPTRARPCEQRANLVAIQPGRVRLIVQTRATNVNPRRAREEALLLGVAVEPADGAQAPGDRGASAAALLEITGVTLDVGAPHRE